MLMNKRKDEEVLKTSARRRWLPNDDHLVKADFLEILSEVYLERNEINERFPNLASKVGGDVWMRGYAQYTDIFRTKDSFKRVAIAGLVMFFQPWN